MILIEFYTEHHIENISTCLRLKPDTLIMAGHLEDMSGALSRYRSLLQRRKQPTAVEVCDLTGSDFADLCQRFYTLLTPEDSYVIDLSGGDATAIMAVGAAYASLSPEKQDCVRILKYDRELEALLDCIHDNREIPGASVRLSVAETVLLHGGIIHPGSYQPPKSFTAAKLQPLWELVADPDTEWNRSISALIEFQSHNTSDLGIRLSLGELEGCIRDLPQKEQLVRKLLGKLDRQGILQDRSTAHTLEYRYTDPVYRYCTEKAGNVLEVKVLLEARELHKNGIPRFNDCLMGVTIDWDGIIHNADGRRPTTPDTRNEIDAVLMKGMVPLFISCKNGDIDEAEIYKLHTVADRFGGPHARKMLIATDPTAVTRSLAQRARDMDIVIITDIASLSRKEWREIFDEAEQE